MKKTLLKMLTLLCTFTVMLGVGTACGSKKEDESVSSSEQIESLEIFGRPENDTATITDDSNTLTLTCDVADGVWASSDKTVATVENGVVTLHAAGSTVISVAKGKKTGEFILTVVDERLPAVITVAIENVPQNNEILLSAQSLQLSATVSDGSEVEWLSRNEAVATVDGTGKVTLLQRGSVEIVAQKKGDASVYNVCALKVFGDPVAELTSIVGISETGNVGTGKPVQLSIVSLPTDCEPFETVWTVEDETVATVSETGELLGLKAGKTTVTATVKGTEISVSKEFTVVETRANYEDFSTAVVIGNYVVGEIEARDASNLLSPEIVYDETADNYYLKYSHAKANGNNKYMIYTFSNLEAGARYVLKYNMKVLSKEGTYNHQINLYSDIDIPVGLNDPLVGNVYNWHTTGLDTADAKIYQSGSTALYRDGLRWKDTDDSTDDFHEYTLGFIAGEATVGFAFLCNNTYEALFDYICVEKAPVLEEYTIASTTRLPVGETYPLTPVALGDAVYYQPFKMTYQSSDETVATVDEKGVVTAVKEGEVTITATDVKGNETTMDITVVPTPDKTVYDIFYEETDERVTNTYLNINYTLPETIAVGAVQGDTYRVTLEIDAIYYVGNMQLYIDLQNPDGKIIGTRNWTSEEFPASGEKKTLSFDIELPWKSGNFDVEMLGVYLRNGTSYQIGVNVVSVQLMEDPMAANYDLWYVGKTESVEKTYELPEAVAGGVQYDTVEVKLAIDLIQGTMPRFKFYLINTNGEQITDPADNGWITVADCYDETTETYVFNATFKWATGNWDVGTLWLLAEDGSYRLGVNVVSVQLLEQDLSENYDLWYEGAKEAVEKTYELPEAVAGGIRYDTAKVNLSLDLLQGTMPRIKFYLLNTDGAQITDPADNGWITVADSYDETTGTYALTTNFKWATGNWDVGTIKLIVEDGSYRLGVNVLSVEIEKATYQLEYEMKSGSQVKVFAFDTVAGGTQNGYVKVTFDVAVFEGVLSNIQFNLCTDTEGQTTVANSNKAWNEDGTKIASSGGQISMGNLSGKKTVTVITTFPWANGNWDLQSIALQLYGTDLHAGVSNIQVELVPDFTPAA